jgi:hypothetical protein
MTAGPNQTGAGNVNRAAVIEPDLGLDHNRARAAGLSGSVVL